ncbi:MAG: polysaccharide pyruvyl transferase family protein, partial [Hyphomicrobiales bacterium]|nr:polysaccharide pyruvyl transferase family protein [Hyphomicrobiales bacterium]
MAYSARAARHAECDAHWQRLCGHLTAALDRAVPPGRPVAYLDYPVHRNLGDLLIYLGTCAWLDTSRRTVAGCWNKDNFPGLPLAKDTVVLLHGGGNFGDIYPAHQRFRESVVAAYPGHRVVILPQSIQFQDAASQAASAAVLNGHGDLHLLVRDRTSLAVARSAFIGTTSTLVPDMASFLYPIPEDGDAAPGG